MKISPGTAELEHLGDNPSFVDEYVQKMYLRLNEIYTSSIQLMKWWNDPVLFTLIPEFNVSDRILDTIDTILEEDLRIYQNKMFIRLTNKLINLGYGTPELALSMLKYTFKVNYPFTSSSVGEKLPTTLTSKGLEVVDEEIPTELINMLLQYKLPETYEKYCEMVKDVLTYYLKSEPKSDISVFVYRVIANFISIDDVVKRVCGEHENCSLEDFISVHDAVTNAVWCTNMKISFKVWVNKLVSSSCIKQTVDPCLIALRRIFNIPEFEKHLYEACENLYTNMFTEILDNNMNDPKLMINLMNVSSISMKTINEMTDRIICKKHPIYEREQVINLYFNKLKGKLTMIYHENQHLGSIKTFDLFLYYLLNTVRHKIFGEFIKVKTKEDSLKFINAYIDKVCEVLKISIYDEDLTYSEELPNLVKMDAKILENWLENAINI